LFNLKVVSIKQETKKIKIFRFSYGEQNFSFLPGQWIDLYVPIEGKNCGGYTIISSNKDKGFFELAIRESQNHPVTKYLHQDLHVGDMLECSNAQGKFYLSDELISSQIVFIAGGIGITPILSMLRSMEATPKKLFYSVSYKEDIIIQSELEPFTTFNMTKEGDQRISVNLLKSNKVDFNSHFFICGPRLMIDALVNDLKEEGVSDTKLHFEKWW
jgi:nitric oxide dioxygenase